MNMCGWGGVGWQRKYKTKINEYIHHYLTRLQGSQETYLYVKLSKYTGCIQDNDDSNGKNTKIIK